MNSILQGDALNVLRTLPDCSVQMCCTSPPYYGLRSYLLNESTDKALEIGTEKTPQEYIMHLVAIFEKVRRVLKKDGVCWIVIGDSFAGSGKGPTGKNGIGNQTKRQGFDSLKIEIPPGFKAKDLMMIPARLAIALQEDGWYLRQDIIWSKANNVPESVKDRPTTSHEHVLFLSKSRRYYYDINATREPVRVAHSVKNNTRAWRSTPVYQANRTQKQEPEKTGTLGCHSTGRNIRSVWTIATTSYKSAHFAVMPEKLVEPCVLAGSHPGDVVLDPFAGAGTVAVVALKNNRDFLAIELNPDYIELIQKRIAVVQPNIWTLKEEVS